MKKIYEWFGKNITKTDTILALSVVFVCWLLAKSGYFDLIWVLQNSTKVDGFYGQAAAIFGSLLGFIITGVTIIFSLLEQTWLKRLKKDSSHSDLYKIHFSAISFLSVTTIFLLVLQLNEAKTISRIMHYFAVSLILISGMKVYRCVWAIKQLVGLLVLSQKKN